MIPSPPSPIFFSIGNFSLRYYSLCILVGVLIAQSVAIYRAKKENIDEDHIYNLVLFSILFGIIGARIFHVLYEYQYYFQNISEIPRIWEGGLAIHGGIAFGAVVFWAYCKYKKLSFFQMTDIAIPSLLIGQIIGRFGNYFNQEAFGTPTSLPWGIHIQESHRPLQYLQNSYFHPTFAYEALWNLLVLGIIILLEKKLPKLKGLATGIYLILYGIGRSLVETIRTDATLLGPLKFVHWLSIILIFSGVWIIYINKQSIKHQKQL